MKKKLFWQIKHVRGALTLTVIFGVLGAVATIAQMALLSRIVNRVFLTQEQLAQVEPLLLLLLGAIIVRAGLVWVREVTAQQGAIRLKYALRQRLFAHLLQLGPAYSLYAAPRLDQRGPAVGNRAGHSTLDGAGWQVCRGTYPAPMGRALAHECTLS